MVSQVTLLAQYNGSKGFGPPQHRTTEVYKTIACRSRFPYVPNRSRTFSVVKEEQCSNGRLLTESPEDKSSVIPRYSSDYVLLM